MSDNITQTKEVDYNINITNEWSNLDRYVKLDKVKLPLLEEIPLCLRNKRPYFYVCTTNKITALFSNNFSLEIYSKPGQFKCGSNSWPVGDCIKYEQFETILKEIKSFISDYKINIKDLKEQKQNIIKKENIQL